MRPVVFESCFGWLHPAEGTHGVVLCSGLGDDAKIMHRPWRDLAERLAARGLPTLRFDYLGTGDSAGDAEVELNLGSWVQSACDAAQFLRAAAGVETLTLVGFRFGANLAVACAERLGGIDGLVLMAPAPSGRAYCRELTLMAKLSLRGVAPAPSQCPEAHGIRLTPEAVAHLEDFGLLQRDQRPARRALILIRDDLPPDRQVAERMAAVGVGVQEGMFANYAQLRWRVDYSAYPAEAFEQVIGWLQPHPRPARPPICYSSEVSLPIPDVRETAMAFGPAPGLFGVLCGPVAPPVGARPTLVFLSPGTTPHMGDDRMWVLMARRFARMGFTSLRFDVAGVGDSSARTGDAAPVANLGQAAADLKAALDWLETVGSKQFILVGYCLGAKVACNLALRDPRVTAQFLINPWRLFWSEGAPLRGFHKPAYYLRAARNPTAWRRVLGGAISGPVFRREARRLARGVLAALRRRISTEETRGSSASCSARAIARRGLARLEQRLFETQTPEQAAAQAAVHRIRSLAARGVNTLLIYGDSDLLLEELEEYFGLGREHLAERLNLHIRLLAGVKHSLLRRSDRDQVVAILEEQLDADRQATADPTAAAERKAVSP